jgi:hypothetical protein
MAAVERMLHQYQLPKGRNLPGIGGMTYQVSVELEVESKGYEAV